MSQRLQRGSGLLWFSVAWVWTDLFCSARLVKPMDVLGASDAGAGSSSSRGGGSGGSGDGFLAVLVDKLSMRFFKYERGELVVIKSPEEPRQRLVRRLAALEGDFVSVGGGRMERLPKGSCWVEADAGVQATGGDSRVSWGAVPLALVEGRVSDVLWPPARWGALSPLPCPSGTHVVGKGGTLEFLHPPTNGDDWWS
ncbi:hypothetical protein ABPG77_011255 [Micractinium sp. CCAP 211/92]